MMNGESQQHPVKEEVVDHMAIDDELPSSTQQQYQPQLGRTQLWQEEEIIRRFGHDYDQPKLGEGYNDDKNPLIQQLPIRYLDQWYLFRRRDAPTAANPNTKVESLWVPRCPLPDEAWMVHDDYVLRGFLRPAPPDRYDYQAPPILVQLNKLYLWCVNRSRTYRGYWIQTKTAMYWLRDPSSKQGKVQVNIAWDDETDDSNNNNMGDTDNMSCEATLPSPCSQEDWHWRHRAKMGLLSNIIDLFPETDEDELTYYATLTAQQLYDELKDATDEPFDFELLRSEAEFAYFHLRGVVEKEPSETSERIPGPKIKVEGEETMEEDEPLECDFLTSLKHLTSSKVWTTAEYQESALRAERRSNNANNPSTNGQHVASLLNHYLTEPQGLSDLQRSNQQQQLGVPLIQNMDDDEDDDSVYEEDRGEANGRRSNVRRGSENKRSAPTLTKKPQLKRLKRKAKVAISDDDSDDDSDEDFAVVIPSSITKKARPQEAPTTPSSVPRTTRQLSSGSSRPPGTEEPLIGRVSRSNSLLGSPRQPSTTVTSTSGNPSSTTATKRTSLSLKSLVSTVSGSTTSEPARRPSTTTIAQNHSRSGGDENGASSNSLPLSMSAIPRNPSKVTSPSTETAAPTTKNWKHFLKKYNVPAATTATQNSSQSFPTGRPQQSSNGHGPQSPGSYPSSNTRPGWTSQSNMSPSSPGRGTRNFPHGSRPTPSQDVVDLTDDFVDLTDGDPVIVVPHDANARNRPMTNSAYSAQPVAPTIPNIIPNATENTPPTEPPRKGIGWGGYPERLSAKISPFARAVSSNSVPPARAAPLASSTSQAQPVPFMTPFPTATSLPQAQPAPFMTPFPTFAGNSSNHDPHVNGTRRESEVEESKPAVVPSRPGYGGIPERAWSNGSSQRRAYNQPPRQDRRSSSYQQTEPRGGASNVVTPPEQMYARRDSSGSSDYQGASSRGSGHPRNPSWESHRSDESGRERRPLAFEPRANSGGRDYNNSVSGSRQGATDRNYYQNEPNPPAGRGRGRDINKPAWMTRGK